MRTITTASEQYYRVEMGGRSRKSISLYKEKLKQVTEIKHFQRNQPLRVICDASTEVLGAVLHQKTGECWQATHFSPDF